MLNGKSDKDSGHGEMSDANSEIETIMSSGSRSSEGSKEPPELIRSNSDVAALLNRRGNDFKDKVLRSRSIDPTKIQVQYSSLYVISSFWVKSYTHGFRLQNSKSVSRQNYCSIAFI